MIGPNVSRKGFTLLEVLVATTIMAIAVVTLLGGISTSMRNAARLTGYDQAVMRARSKMDELIVNHRVPSGAELDENTTIPAAGTRESLLSKRSREHRPGRPCWSAFSSKSGGPKAASAIHFRWKDTAAE